MTVDNKQKKLIDDLVLDLQSNDEKRLASALKRVRAKGSEEVVPWLFKLIEKKVDKLIQEEAKQIILELKSTKAIPALLNQLKSENPKARELALSAFWHSSFNAKEHIDKFVEAAINGSFMETLEAYTIIDNLEGPFDEVVIIESQLLLKKYFTENKEKNDKNELLITIATIIDTFEKTVYSD